MRDGPSTTAELVCFMRATDQAREKSERILDDPYATRFLRPPLRATLAAGKLGEAARPKVFGLTTFILVRHRYIDDRLEQALRNDEVSQVVLLGAGYDTRAYRLSSLIGDRPVFEVDHPSTAARKRKIVRQSQDWPSVDVRWVDTDFQRQSVRDRLIESGFVEGAPTFFVWEGVSMYLTRAAVKETLRTIHAMSSPGSSVAMDYWFMLDEPDLVSALHRMTASMMHFLGEPITFGIHPEDVVGFLQRLGWTVEATATARDLAKAYVKDRRFVYPASYLVHAKTAGS